jgi:hypothetical protein
MFKHPFIGPPVSAALLLALVLAGCGGGEKAAEVVRQADPPASATPRNREDDDAARYLAGLPGEPGGPFAALEMSPAWQIHRASLDAAWAKAEKGLVARLQHFADQELRDLNWAAPVFYPFGGPDALTVTQLFPRSPAYTIVGLEPVGTLPSMAQFQEMDSPKYLAETRATMASALGKSFFITHEMDRQFRGQVTDGLLLPILQLLVRTHHRVLGYRYVVLNDEGELREREASPAANSGVQIEFEGAADASVHTLTYFSVNLANDRLAANKPFLRYLSARKGVTTFLKATSYMTHDKRFSIIRDAMLESSGRVVQDDSGIPYASFVPENWDVQLYGQYTQPYGSFKWRRQADLQAAYAAGGAKPLELQMGYGYGRVGSNLLVAKRK